MPEMRIVAVWQKDGSMTLHAALSSAVEMLRPGTKPQHSERLVRDLTATLKRELRWLDIYEEEKRCRF